jgi:hypothetical protein
MTKGKNGKSKVQGEQSKEIVLVESQPSKAGDDHKVEFQIDHRMTLKEAAKLLNRSVEKIIDYAVSGVLKIDYMVSNGYVAELAEEQLDLFSKDIDTKIDVPRGIISVSRMLGCSTDGKEYVISKTSLRVKEKDLSDLRNRLTGEAEDEKRSSLYDTHGESRENKENVYTVEAEVVSPDEKIEPENKHADVPSRYEFLLKGEYWKITYEGKTEYFKNTKGWWYIHYLLENTEKEFYALELVRELNIITQTESKGIYAGLESDEKKGQLIEDGLGILGTADVIDIQAIIEYKNRRNELKDELEDETVPKSKERCEELLKEIEKISKELGSRVNIHGKSRQIANHAENARKAISKAIRNSLDKIEDEKNGNPVLWHHFRNTLTIGTVSSYKPEKPIDWDL